MSSDANTIYREFLSVLGLNPFIGNTSSPRAQMNYSHLGQALVISGCEPRYIVTGAEEEFGKFTFKKNAPSDIEIVRVIPKFLNTGDLDSVRYNPSDLVIYQDINNGEYGILELTNYCSYHQSFGFEYQKSENYNRISKGAIFEKGTVFLDSPAIKEKEQYCIGRQLETAFMSLPGVAEDGFIICEDMLPFFSYKTYERFTVSCGETSFPINKYGTQDFFKAFPDVGEYVGEDSVLIALRNYDPLLAPVQQSIYDVLKVDQKFDRCTYISKPGGKVVDISIVSADPCLVENKNPLERQFFKYIHASLRYNKAIVEEYKRIKSKWGDNLKITKEFHRLIIDALATTGEPLLKAPNKESDISRRITKIRKNQPIDHFHLEFVIENNNIPEEGNKFTDMFGGKGVLCGIWPKNKMPVDKDGNVAMIITNGGSSIDRMNVGRNIEHIINAAGRDVRKKILFNFNLNEIQQTNLKKINKNIEQQIKIIHQTNKDLFDSNYNYLINYYDIINKKQANWLREISDDLKINHMVSVLTYHPVIYHPPETDSDKIKMLTDIKKYYCPTYDQVSLDGIKTLDKVLIGPIYYILLEKTGKDWSAVSSAKVQHFGIPAQLNRSDKSTEPTRSQPVRTQGESENRILISYTSPILVAEMMDRNNNPDTHKKVVESILNAENPTNIQQLIDRKEHPYGGARPIVIMNHMLYCYGIKLAYGENQ